MDGLAGVTVYVVCQGLAAVKVIQHIIYTFPLCASIGEAFLVTSGLDYCFGDMVGCTVAEDYNPKLYNFGMIEGGILNEKDHYPGRHLRGWMYYTDPYTNCYDYYTEVSDIYSFGMVLLNLIAKKIEMDKEGVYDHEWAYDEYEQAVSRGRWGLKHFSLADKSFSDETDFDFITGHRISKLVMRCIHRDYSKRPTIDKIYNYLEKLVSHRK